MTTTAELLVDGLERVRQAVHDVLDGLPDDALTTRIGPDANTIAWLLWHLTRVQDDHVSEVAGREQTWTADGWAERLGLPEGDTGYGHTSAQVAGVHPTADELRGYHDAVSRASQAWVAGLADADLDRVVDEAYDPPVTLAVRLVSVLQDDLMHVGQAAFAKGVM